MREEYTRENYPSFGKKYAGEKAIISLTSWKARIDTVSKTLYSLIKQCPGFHIVLVLSEEEFPKMMDEMPANLNLFVKNNLIEVLWVYKNYKSFKKWIFTADKYRDVPIISADDDCIYICNYAQELYDKWLENKNINGIRYEFGKLPQMQGPTSLYYLKENVKKIISQICKNDIEKSEDDKILYQYMKNNECNFSFVHKKTKKPYIFHDTISPLHSDDSYKKILSFKSCFR